MSRTWIVEVVRDDEVGEALNRLEADGAFELQGVYVLGARERVTGGLILPRELLIVAWRPSPSEP